MGETSIDVLAIVMDNDQLLLRRTADEWILPCCSTTSIEQGKKRIADDLSEMGYVIEFREERLKNTHKNAYVYVCDLLQGQSIKNKKYEWIELNMAISMLCKNTMMNSSGVVEYLSAIRGIFSKIQDDIQHIFDQRIVRLEVQISIESIQIFIHHPELYVPFLFCVDYYFDGESISYTIRWKMTNQIAPGNRSDLYHFFSSTMSALLKIMCNQPVFICLEQWDWFGSNDEDTDTVIDINYGEIVFDPKYYEKQLISNVEFPQLVISYFIDFNEIMGMHSVFFGSVSNNLMKSADGYEIEEIFKSLGDFERIDREESVCIYNNTIMCFKTDSLIPFSEFLLDIYQYETINGNDGKLLFQFMTNEDNLKVQLHQNYIDNDIWKIIHFIISKMGYEQYSILCQSNTVFIVSNKDIWAINGLFHHYIAELEMQEIIKRREQEDFLLQINRKFKWKYPLNPGRFECLIKELLEFQFPVAKVRLVGTPNNADGGRDILIRSTRPDSTEELIIGQCKAYKHSVNKSNVIDIRDTLEMYEANGYFLAVSSAITTPLLDNLMSLRTKFLVDWWTEKEIFKLLKKYPSLVAEYADLIEIY